MTRSTSTILSLAFVVVFGVSSMALYSKIMQHGTRLENVISVQEAARQNPGGMRVSPMIRLGIKYYDDLQRPVSRDQMEGAHAAFVEATREIAEEDPRWSPANSGRAA